MNTDTQNIYDDIERFLIKDEKPSINLDKLSEGNLPDIYPFNMLTGLKHTKQSPKYHPEGNVWNHTMLVVDEAARVKDKSSDARAFMWAALLHDIGKPETTKITKDKITSYDHEKAGARLAKDFLREFTDNESFIGRVSALIRWHMQILHVLKKLPFADIKRMKSETDINDVALLGLCDRLGRLNSDREAEEANIKKFIQLCNKE